MQAICKSDNGPTHRKTTNRKIAFQKLVNFDEKFNSKQYTNDTIQKEINRLTADIFGAEIK